MTQTEAPAARCAALVGPYTGGKTTLMEAMLHAAGAIHRKGSIPQGNTVGDPSPEARERQMSVEPNFAHCEYLGDYWSIVDCRGLCRNVFLIADHQSGSVFSGRGSSILPPRPIGV